MTDTSLFDQEDREYLAFTQNTRKRIADEMLKKGIPDDKEDRAFLLQAIDGLDRTTLNRARIKADDSANKNQASMTGLVASLLSTINIRGVNKANEEYVIENDIKPARRELDTEIKVTTPVLGETDIGVSDTNYETFIESVNQ